MLPWPDLQFPDLEICAPARSLESAGDPVLFHPVKQVIRAGRTNVRVGAIMQMAANVQNPSKSIEMTRIHQNVSYNICICQSDQDRSQFASRPLHVSHLSTPFRAEQIRDSSPESTQDTSTVCHPGVRGHPERLQRTWTHRVTPPACFLQEGCTWICQAGAHVCTASSRSCRIRQVDPDPKPGIHPLFALHQQLSSYRSAKT